MRLFDRRHHAAATEVDEVQREVDVLPFHVWFTSAHRWAEDVPGAWLKKFGHLFAKYAQRYTSDHFRNVVIGWWNKDILRDGDREWISKLKAKHDAELLRKRK